MGGRGGEEHRFKFRRRAQAGGMKLKTDFTDLKDGLCFVFAA